MPESTASMWAVEYMTLSQRWDALLCAMGDNGDSILIRQKLHRVEACMSALLGSPEALSA